jgi:uncharacterized protein (TIGR03790 family)
VSATRRAISGISPVLSLTVSIAALLSFSATVRADDTPVTPASTNAAPAQPPLFLAPKPLTSDQPEAPPIEGLGTPTPPSSADATANSKSAAPPPATDQPQFVVPLPLRFTDPAGQPDDLPAHLLVVYNAKDAESESLARYYAKARQIPPERVLSISCPVREEITRTEFDHTIRDPILADLVKHHWIDRQSQTVKIGDRTLKILAATRNEIWAIVLLRGVPLKIADSPPTESSLEPQPQLKTNAAAVDSELALLPVSGLPPGGFVPNPFFDAYNSGEVRAGPELATKLIMVTRLDGPSAGDVRRMIDDCLAAEKNRLAGLAVIDSRGFTDAANGYTEGDRWLRTSRNLLAADGWPVLFDDRPATLPATEPVNHVAIYLGWYTPTANGPWITPPNRFVPGAIAYHLHSFSAWTVRSPTQNWVGPLIDHGADATMGNVYEPYLALTPHLDIFTQRLLDGDAFCEAAYASELGLSWMTTVVGDPLYRPFRRPLEEAIAAAPPGEHRDWLRLQLLERQLDAHPPAAAAALATAFQLPNAGAVLNERLGDLMQKVTDPASSDAAEKAYEAALNQSTEPIDRIRIGLKLAQAYASHDEDARAQAELQSLRESFPVDALRFGVVPMAAGLDAGVRSAPTQVTNHGTDAAPFNSDAP